MKHGFVNEKIARIFFECCQSLTMEDLFPAKDTAAPEKTADERMKEARAAVKELLNGGAQDDEIRAAVKECLRGADDGQMAEIKAAVHELFHGEEQ